MKDIPFSIIVTCYNVEKYIGQCLDSITSQSYDRFEVICVDDGSTDASGDILKGYARRFACVTYLQKENSGLEKACNDGIRNAQYEQIVRADADDYFDPHLLAMMNKAIQRYPDYDFYYCKDYVEFYSKKRQLKKELPPFDADEIFDRGDFFATGTIYKKSDLRTIGYFPEKVKNCGLENYSVILKLLSLGKKGMAVKDALFYYRRHDLNMSTVKRDEIIHFGHKLLAEYGMDFRTNKHHPYGLVFPPRVTA